MGMMRYETRMTSYPRMLHVLMFSTPDAICHVLQHPHTCPTHFQRRIRSFIVQPESEIATGIFPLPVGAEMRGDLIWTDTTTHTTQRIKQHLIARASYCTSAQRAPHAPYRATCMLIIHSSHQCSLSPVQWYVHRSLRDTVDTWMWRVHVVRR